MPFEGVCCVRDLVRISSVWLVAWVLVVPLVHVHPEADHRHGLPGHVHGGTFHTVLSPELPCASRPPTSEKARQVLSAAPTGALIPFGTGDHLGAHPAIGFSFLAGKTSPLIGHQAQSVFPETCAELPRLARAASPSEAIIDSPLLLLSWNAHSRAPPSLLRT